MKHESSALGSAYGEVRFYRKDKKSCCNEVIKTFLNSLLSVHKEISMLCGQTNFCS